MLRGTNITLTPPAPSPLMGEGELDKFLVPLSLNGRGARGEGLRNFHVTS